MTDDAPPKKAGLLFIFLTVFIDLLGFGIVLPLLPIYSLDPRFKLEEWQLGLLFSSFSGMQLIFAPLWGRVSDRVGRRPVLLGGLVGTAASYVLFAFAQDRTMLFAARFLAGFFGATVSTAQAYIADITTQEDRAKGMGLIGAAFGLGFTFGPLIGGELAAHDFRWPGLFAAGLSLTAATLGFFKVAEPPKGKSRGKELFGLDQVRRAATEGRLGVLFVISFLFLFAFSGFETMFARFGLARFPEVFHIPAGIEQPTIQQVMAAAPVAGRWLAFIGIVSAFIQGGLIRRLVPRFGETKLAIVAPLFLAAAFVIVGAAPSPGGWWVVITGCALMPLGIGLNNPAVFGLVSRAAPEDEQGAYLGLNQSVSSLARMTGPAMAGVVFQRLGPQAPFFVGAGLLLLGCGVASLYHARWGHTFPRKAPTTTPAA